MKTTNPKDYIELLEFFRIALNKGILEKNEVIKWADNIITSDSEPDYFIIELALSGQNGDPVAIINEFVGEKKPQVPIRVILGFLYKRYIDRQITLRKTIRILYEFTWSDSALMDQEINMIYQLDYDFECVDAGIYGTIETVEKETLRFLEVYKNFRIDNYSEWKNINIAIEHKIKEIAGR